MATGASATARIQPKKQTLDDAYAPPANFLEIDLVNPETHGIGNKRYTDYELKMRVRTPPTRSRTCYDHSTRRSYLGVNTGRLVFTLRDLFLQRRIIYTEFSRLIYVKHNRKRNL